MLQAFGHLGETTCLVLIIQKEREECGVTAETKSSNFLITIVFNSFAVFKTICIVCEFFLVFEENG